MTVLMRRILEQDGEEIEVTPELAKQWLEKNRCGRPINRRWVFRMTYAMLTHPATFLKEGVILRVGDWLCDGQHRLEALAAAGVSAKMVLIQLAEEPCAA